MSVSTYRMNRTKMIDLLNYLALLMHDVEEPIDLVCIGGASLILFDERFQYSISADIDAFVIDMSPFPTRFRDYVYDVTDYENDIKQCSPELGYDWLNDDLLSSNIVLDFELDEYLPYLVHSKTMYFYNEYNEVVLTLTPATTEIILMSKAIAYRFKDIPIIEHFTKEMSLTSLQKFHQYFQNCVENFATDNRYIQALAHVSKSIYGHNLQNFYNFLNDEGITYDTDQTEEYYNEEPWGLPY